MHRRIPQSSKTLVSLGGTDATTPLSPLVQPGLRLCSSPLIATWPCELRGRRRPWYRCIQRHPCGRRCPSSTRPASRAHSQYLEEQDPAKVCPATALPSCENLDPPTDGGSLGNCPGHRAPGRPPSPVLTSSRRYLPGTRRAPVQFAFVLLEIGAREIAKKAGKKSGIRSAGHWGTFLPLGVNALRLAHSEVLTGGGGSDS